MPRGKSFNIGATRVLISAPKPGLILFNTFSIVWASVSIRGKDPFSGERLTLNHVFSRSSPPHWLDVSGTFRRETIQPLLPLIGTSTMCLQCYPCVSEAVGFLRINRYLKSGKCSSAVEARLLRFWEEILKYNRRIYPPPPLHMPVKETGNLQSAVIASVPSPLTTSAEAGGRTLPSANNALSATAPSSSTSAEPYTASSPDLLSTSKYSPSDDHRLQSLDPRCILFPSSSSSRQNRHHLRRRCRSAEFGGGRFLRLRLAVLEILQQLKEFPIVFLTNLEIDTLCIDTQTAKVTWKSRWFQSATR
ncbi:uncharacterized protein LOC111202844 isoform X1 [Brassica napus]|uniref:uncharacterized protein LOC111202844 isoform X1 n=1 Tax=Brassica napus TaxID=3708 RepID=UPI00207A0C07|nr:uncharacterized protein LOC111202844 isoform X1 [Brassica napus]XP_048615016.1 uncharacterized protein LOC111202844 isoform X1 [Brassica napus]XP_048615017.1 uncharacterized protein LOC111202844 isoform X1 [Brassica napus]